MEWENRENRTRSTAKLVRDEPSEIDNTTLDFLSVVFSVDKAGSERRGFPARLRVCMLYNRMICRRTEGRSPWLLYL